MLGRFFAVVHASTAALADYDRRRDAAQTGDHRRLAQELDLFTVSDEVGRGLPLLLPGGAAMRLALERFIVDEELARGYQLVYTPAIGKRELYVTSGHLEH